jgi:hypothetical protein
MGASKALNETVLGSDASEKPTNPQSKNNGMNLKIFIVNV